jgi:predicted DNA-binding protein (UPF0251 family)/predicted Fe-Mo cluster-binding NifX family protein
MARPCKSRKLESGFSPVLYIPSGWTQTRQAPAELAIEDFEILRLVDGHAHSLEEAAAKVGVSRSTAGRMVARARRILARALEQHAPLYIDASDSGTILTTGAKRPPEGSGSGNLAFAVEEAGPHAPLSRVFGRAPYFAIVSRDDHITYLQNPGRRAKRQAASLAVEQLKAEGVCRVAAGRFGPDALERLGTASIQPLCVAGLDLEQAIELIPMDVPKL